jgi:hypothetical protein
VCSRQDGRITVRIAILLTSAGEPAFFRKEHGCH